MPVDATLEKTLPNNLDAERSVLGAILLDNNALNVAIEKLRPEDFFHDHHRRVFTQMIALGESQQAIDLVTLTEELHRKGDLEASGGAPYLAALADGMPKVSNIEHYARIVKEKAMLRNLIHATHNIQQRAFEGEDGADTILDNAESSIFALAEDRVKAGLIPIKEIVRDNFERLGKDLPRRQEHHRNPHGLHRTRQAHVGTAAFGVADSGGAAFAGEDGAGAESDGKRCDSWRAPGGHVQPGNVQGIAAAAPGGVGRADRRTQIPHRASQPGRLAPYDGITGNDFVRAVVAGRCGVDQRTGDWRESARLKRDKGLSMLIVDYLQLITGRGRFGNRQEEVSSISRALKGLAKELQIPVLVLSQLSRAPERDERGPQLSDLRESGAIEQDADVVMFIYRPHFFKQGATPEEREETELKIAKQRNGPVDSVKFVFRSRFTRFEEAAPDAFSQFNPDNM